jgi:hypothetical protein
MKRTLLSLCITFLFAGCAHEIEMSKLHYETEQKRFEATKSIEVAKANAGPADNTILEIKGHPGKSITIDAASLTVKLPSNLQGGGSQPNIGVLPTQQFAPTPHPGWQVANTALNITGPILGIWASLQGASGLVNAVNAGNTAIANSGFAATTKVANSGLRAASTSNTNLANVSTSGFTNMNSLGQTGILGVQSTAATGSNNMNSLGQVGVFGVQNVANTGATNLNSLGQAGIL